ncbi:Putative fructose transport system kinase OS=Tsukamurella paurometabola (strain ATCC 8368 / DSM/ CCUG 35730 / CIP 100753 / JCM 10117 / KCTC 9821 / NBRC 16120 / NCIMB 702349 / NCTC 13040) OX=521096 GN=Tpau_3554 PE=4 SV=1 [Tsukamurella paurometabola]|uniref:Putative fructose transport system kinase n=1 Tax=Tsukamurella paurometabola (strain ATCC 8368 / DSM 20162 / CCUG 35730 / CIP 100753 / JCM 10117 / KCTC 9821 / NBRC 16120 / NCIMB 702349 / NCTC 13040) TaxID=521096 RepID=D5UXB4_TSUPD|nr:nucleoside/nucleotide kinase family protein [Tsukamurella paurometabola]ADG80133.1 putative fructose transport system kinase [Tsukamurella paurometabola DSM 20162]SUP38536.1 nucleoside triphosphate hydrolase domain-containing protein [Tsukamurella paurometabola]
MTDTFERLLADARALTSRPGRTILGITGAPASGKSTLAERLVEELGDAAALVPMDGFHLDDAVLRAHGSWGRKGAIDTFDGAGYAHLLRRLRVAEHTVYAPRFDRGLEASIAGAVEIPPTVPLVVTEGNYLLADTGPWPAARAAIDEVWFLRIDTGIRRERLIERHRRFGRSLDDARERALGSDENNAELIESGAGRADRIVVLD